MTFLNRYRPILYWIAIVIAASCLVAPFIVMATGCVSRYQPPGQDLWRAL